MPIHPERWKSLLDRYQDDRPRRMLALDGGGIRGLITLGFLQRIEAMIREKTGQALCEYFDYIGGTSTGAIIAASLARGMTTADLVKFYTDFGRAMFDPSALLERFKYLHTADPLIRQLQQVFGATTRLYPDDLKCLLLVVTKNVTTDSAWPVSSNPDAKYNDPARNDNNLNMPLWKLVRASTAAPVYFPAEVMTWNPANPSKAVVFVDGGMTPYNNPAFLLYRMATEPAYRLNWTKGENNLLLISVGTGAAESLGATAAAPNKNIVSTVAGLPGALMYAMQVDQDIACRSVGRCTYGTPLDRELMDLVPRSLQDGLTLEESYAAPKIPLTKDLGRSFLYARYNADLSRSGLNALGFPDVDPDNIQKMDCPDNIPTLLKIGQAASGAVQAEHFGPFL
ncbi:patatin-like phospholipase family protein [Tunturibacter psychrotolerans]|uniref:Patatin-like phospholipase family protein n=1 Tax=Tunturiibacter psychrotolerans TaxID=3069686 RepID=A0AAU7ZPW2_9BACT